MSDSFIIPAAVIGSGISFAISAVIYNKYQQVKETLKKIEVAHFKADYELWKEVQKHKRLYAAVEGKVLSNKSLKSNFAPDNSGFIQGVTTREQQAPTVRKELLFSLAAENAYGGKLPVCVESPLKAEGDYLKLVHRSEKLEKMLSDNSVVTVIGNVVMEQGNDDKMVLEPPKDGQKFFIFSGGYDSVKKRHERKCKLLQMGSVAGKILGFSILGMLGYSTLNTEKKRN